MWTQVYWVACGTYEPFFQMPFAICMHIIIVNIQDHEEAPVGIRFSQIDGFVVNEKGQAPSESHISRDPLKSRFYLVQYLLHLPNH